MTATPPPPLAYAPRPSRFGRHRGTRAIVVAVATVALIAPRWWPPVWRHARLLYWQHRCMTDATPAYTVAWTVTGGSRRVPAWDEFGTLLSPPGYHPRAVSFLHEMRTPSGVPMLVCVTANVVTPYSNSVRPHLVVTVIRPGTLISDPIDVTDLARRSFAVDDAEPTTLYAGTVDPSDPAHFVMLGSDDRGLPLTFDGRLADDDRVMIQQRAVPGR